MKIVKVKRCLFVTFYILFLAKPSHAEIVFDGSVGDRAPGDVLSGNSVIGENDGTKVGSNLFHSFTTFNINGGESVTFTSESPDIKNLISRVTGNSASLIDGELNTPDKLNFWFINPNGVVFGDNATVNVNGSFYLSAADSIQFSDGAALHAATPGADIFTMTGDPSGFGFIDNPELDKTIRINGARFNLNLREEGEREYVFSLVAGCNDCPDGEGMTVNGATFLVKSQGLDFDEVSELASYFNVLIASVKGAASVAFSAPVSSPAGFVMIEGERSNIRFVDSLLRTSYIETLDGHNSLVYKIYHAGAVDIRGGDVAIVNENSTFIESVTLESAADINVDASGTLTLDKTRIAMQSERVGGVRLHGDKGVRLLSADLRQTADYGDLAGVSLSTGGLFYMNGGVVRSDYNGDNRDATNISGGISITARDLDIANHATLSTSDRSAYTAGDISLTAARSLRFFDSVIDTSSNSYTAPGDAGDISLRAYTIAVGGDSAITSTSGSQAAAACPSCAQILGGRSGGVTFETGVEKDGVFTQGGGITIGSAEGATLISTASYSSAGRLLGIDRDEEGSYLSQFDAGDIRFKTGDIVINNAHIASDSHGLGEAGTINIDAQGRVKAGREAVISSVTYRNTYAELQDNETLEVIKWKPGDSGDIEIRAGEADLGGALLSTESQGLGAAGRIDIRTEEALRGTGVRIVSQSEKNGAAGAISLSGGNVALTDSLVTSSSEGLSDAGGLVIAGHENVLLNNSVIATRADQAGGGDINIEAGRTLVIDESSITASTTAGAETPAGRHDGGNILLQADFILVRDGKVEATANAGDGGRIHINARSSFLADRDSQIDVSSVGGGDGVLDINAGLTSEDLGASQVELQFMDVSDLMRDKCSAAVRDNNSSFVVAAQSADRSPQDYQLSPSDQAARDAEADASSWLSAGVCGHH
ncbi:Large exoprotein involved in heme utilization or adhesion [Hahella chejuensis KCTC 2396]|uniref:Large exoprotein involved in heme utilization or adhesion n=1 Tax=Hahella chejuensis (strain KCTC 2396) TaxID=349521 RepID=Q2SGU8_HAHCH|nr:filamentous hemagglutinin N-terminal domain-containing protein [Hahella chejuensis]ABC30126.1 Large exoprotein involved in heme utilization or adhesion [Hahella chejuensis KCTC 2396]